MPLLYIIFLIHDSQGVGGVAVFLQVTVGLLIEKLSPMYIMVKRQVTTTKHRYCLQSNHFIK